MRYEQTILQTLAYIDDHISDEITVALLAKGAGYSAYHFSRLFSESVGMSAMAYVTRRRLRYALYDLSQGKSVLDTAVSYGFETHAGFTKAFKRHFGYPPSLCHLRVTASPPGKADLETLESRYNGGNTLNPHIIELTPFSVVGYPSRHAKPNVRNTGDAPTFWNTIHLDYSPILEKLYDAFPKSKHCEISMCYDGDENTGEFTYMLGRGIDNPADLANIQPDMTRVDIIGGLYAIFSTPPADSYIQTAQDTWNGIFLNWLPNSEFEYDDTRHDFEYHDQRDHGWYFGGKSQIDICIPIRQREEEIEKSRARL